MHDVSTWRQASHLSFTMNGWHISNTCYTKWKWRRKKWKLVQSRLCFAWQFARSPCKARMKRDASNHVRRGVDYIIYAHCHVKRDAHLQKINEANIKSEKAEKNRLDYTTHFTSCFSNDCYTTFNPLASSFVFHGIIKCHTPRNSISEDGMRTQIENLISLSLY